MILRMFSKVWESWSDSTNPASSGTVKSSNGAAASEANAFAPPWQQQARQGITVWNQVNSRHFCET